MAKDECIPFWDPGDTITAHASTAVVGKRLVSVVAPGRVDGNPAVSHTGAGAGRVFGVTGYTAPAGSKVTVWHEDSIIVPIRAGAAVGANALVQSDADGQIIPLAGGVCVGCTLEAGAAGADVPVDRSIRS